jgi:hypothetical protein
LSYLESQEGTHYILTLDLQHVVKDRMAQCTNLNFSARFQSQHKKSIKDKLKLSQIVLIDEQSNESQESKSQQSQLYRTLLSSLSFNPHDFSEKDLKFD